jgi:DNA-binding response OmpR family regulator
MRALVVDDEPAIVKTVTRIFREHQVDGVTDAESAVAKVHEIHYDLIFLDYRMPGNDGEWFLRHAKLTPKTKVLLLTGFLDSTIVRTMFDLGICGYVPKPFRATEIRQQVELHFGLNALAG